MAITNLHEDGKGKVTKAETSFRFNVYDVDMENGTFNFSSTYDELLEHINKGERVYGVYHEENGYLVYDYILELSYMKKTTLFFTFETLNYGSNKAFQFEIYNDDTQYCGVYMTSRNTVTVKNNVWTAGITPTDFLKLYNGTEPMYDITHKEYYFMTYVNTETKTCIWQSTIINDDGGIVIRTLKGVGNSKTLTYTEKTIE